MVFRLVVCMLGLVSVLCFFGVSRVSSVLFSFSVECEGVLGSSFRCGMFSVYGVLLVGLVM